MQKSYKVLIVEDEDSIRNSYALFLKEQGFEVETANNGEEALEKAKTFEYDVMLLDIMLPKVDGLDVLKQVKSNLNTKDRKVILLTALGRDSVIKEGFELGADSYLMKEQENPGSVKDKILKTLEG